MKTKILFGRPCLGDHRVEVGSLLVEVALASQGDPRIEDVVHCPISRFPTSVARNVLVKTAREQGCDILFMVDSDMFPCEGFFKTAVDFLLNHEGPAVIASPYTTSAPREDVCVFEWAAGRSSSNGPPPDAPFALVNIVREDAARRTGIERVANVGTGYIAYSVKAFGKIDHPYFDYDYGDKTHTNITETEDCWAHRKLFFAGVPLYVSWDHWSKHRKSYWAEKPVRLTDANVNSVFLTQARAELAHGGKELASLVPADVPGWCDFAEVYDMAVKQAKPGARFVEVGSWQGQSAILMARLIKRSGKSIRFTCVDHFQGSQEHHELGMMPDTNLRDKFEANVERHKVADKIQVLPIDSSAAAATFADNSLDFVFLDASHDEDSVRRDIESWFPKVKNGGILAGHDYDFFGVCRAVTGALPAKSVRLMGRSWVYTKKAEATP